MRILPLLLLAGCSSDLCETTEGSCPSVHLPYPEGYTSSAALECATLPDGTDVCFAVETFVLGGAVGAQCDQGTDIAPGSGTLTLTVCHAPPEDEQVPLHLVAVLR